MKVAAAQYPLSRHKNLKAWQTHIEKWVKEAAEQKADLLVFPEYGSMELVSTMKAEIQKNLAAQIKAMNELLPIFQETFQSLAKKYSCLILAPSLPILNEKKKPINRAYFFGPSSMSFQDKENMTRFEDEQWGVISGGEVLQVFETKYADIGVNICFDVEFPYAANKLARSGVKVLLAPSCTEGLRGCHRVHVGARARALENQYYVVVAQTVGDCDCSQAVDKNTGFAAFYGPPDLGFPEDGILAKGKLNEPGWVFCDLDLSKVDHVRENGQVFNFKKM